MVVSDTHKLVYIAPPKTGTSTVLMLLRNHFNGHVVKRKPQSHHHDTLLLPKKQDYFHFMTVRHPYLRMHSYWKFQRMICKTPKYQADPLQNHNTKAFPIKHPFPGFRKWLLQGPTNRKMRRSFYAGMGRVLRSGWHIQQLNGRMPFIVHMEKMNEELKQVPGFEQLASFPKINKGPEPEKPWYDEFNAEVIRVINKYWGEDYKLFGYEPSFEAVKAGQLFKEGKL